MTVKMRTLRRKTKGGKADKHNKALRKRSNKVFRELLEQAKQAGRPVQPPYP